MIVFGSVQSSLASDALPSPHSHPQLTSVIACLKAGVLDLSSIIDLYESKLKDIKLSSRKPSPADQALYKEDGVVSASTPEPCMNGKAMISVDFERYLRRVGD